MPSLFLRQPHGIGVLRVNTVLSGSPTADGSVLSPRVVREESRRQGGLRAGPRRHFCDGRPEAQGC